MRSFVSTLLIISNSIFLYAQDIDQFKYKVDFLFYEDSANILDNIKINISIQNLDTILYTIYHSHTSDGQLESGTTYLEFKESNDTNWNTYEKIRIKFELDSKPIIKLGSGQTISTGYLEVLPARKYVVSSVSYEPLIKKPGRYNFRVKYFPFANNANVNRSNEYIVSNLHSIYISDYNYNQNDYQAFNYLMSTSRPLLFSVGGGINETIIYFNLLDSTELHIADTFVSIAPNSKFSPWAYYALLRSEFRKLNWQDPQYDIENNLIRLKIIKNIFIKITAYGIPELNKILTLERRLYNHYFFRIYPDAYETLDSAMLKEYLDF